MKRSRKKNVNVAIAAFIALMIGITVWSCSQDDIEDHCPRFYRYSSEEISTLRSIAEDYGVPDIRFITESPYPLPSMQEMETTFAEFAAIKQILARPLEVTDSTEGTKVLETKSIPFTRIKRSMPETSTEGFTIDEIIAAYGRHFDLKIKVSITTDKNKPEEQPKISVTGNLDIPKESDNIVFRKKKEETKVTWQESSKFGLYYSCILEKCDIKRSGGDKPMIVVVASERVTKTTTVPF